MTRQAVIDKARQTLASGELFRTLSRRVAMPTESQNPDRAAEMRRYLDEEMIPALRELGFTCVCPPCWAMAMVM